MGMSNDELRDDLTSIDGVGDATADKILDVLDAHDTGGGESDLLRKARECASEGKDRRAGMFLRRDMGEE